MFWQQNVNISKLKDSFFMSIVLGSQKTAKTIIQKILQKKRK